MAINTTQEETWALNILNNSAVNAQAELQRVVSARASYLKLLEDKYKATFDERTGTFIPKEASKEGK